MSWKNVDIYKTGLAPNLIQTISVVLIPLNDPYHSVSPVLSCLQLRAGSGS